MFALFKEHQHKNITNTIQWSYRS